VTVFANATEVFTKHNRSVIFASLNSRQFKKWLASQGAIFEPGKGGHLKVTLNGKRSVLPMSSGDLKKGTMGGIKKQLGLKE
jgi:mRNA interferase HicA